jgi:hypothetical protein
VSAQPVDERHLSLARMAWARIQLAVLTPKPGGERNDPVGIIAEAIARAVADLPTPDGEVIESDETIDAASVAVRLGITKTSASARLRRLFKRRVLIRVGYGVYAIRPGFRPPGWLPVEMRSLLGLKPLPRVSDAR